MRRGLGLAGHLYGEARGTGGAGCEAVVACAKSGEARLRGGVRWWRRKATAFERGAWAAGGEAGMEASGQAGEVCLWRAAWERGAGLARVRTWRCGLTRPIEKGHAMPLIIRRKFAALFSGSSKY